MFICAGIIKIMFNKICKSKYCLILLLIIVSVPINSCANSGNMLQKDDELKTVTSTVVVTPSPTPMPLAAIVDNESILLSDYEEELKRFDDAASEENIELAEQEKIDIVIEEMINKMILAQSAKEDGYDLSEDVLSQKIQELIESAGGDDVFNQWLLNNHYTRDSFERFYSIEIRASWKRDQIIKNIETSREQVHARQILVLAENVAYDIYNQLEAGANFATLANNYDPILGGDLGWFPRGYLTQMDVENAAFELEPGQYSNVISTDLGYHIVQVIAKDPQRELAPDAKQVIKHLELDEWLETKYQESNIEIFVTE